MRWSHHVVGEVFHPSHRENGEQWDDGDVPGYGCDNRDTLLTTCIFEYVKYTHRRLHGVDDAETIDTLNKLDS